jgi:hypothetical protein
MDDRIGFRGKGTLVVSSAIKQERRQGLSRFRPQRLIPYFLLV